MPTVGEKKDRKRARKSGRVARLEGVLHWWNLIHLIDSKWSNSDLAGHDRFLSVGIKTCPVERRDNGCDYHSSGASRFKRGTLTNQVDFGQSLSK